MEQKIMFMMDADMALKPIILVFAGPNGSGKSTFSRSIPIIGTYVNADDLKAAYNLTDLEAAQQAEALRNKLLNKKVDFSFETVLSTERNILLLQKAKEAGYHVQCIYILTCSADINVARVMARVAAGGHDVPEEKIRIRYQRALAMLPKIIPICDKILIYDNTDEPVLIYKKENMFFEYYPNIFWSENRLKAVLGLL